ncbi:MAG: TM1812 family CRISPR-associated protein [Calditrichaceae bacterium]
MKTKRRKILITSIGLGNMKTGYDQVEWNFNGTSTKERLPFILIADHLKVDHILILGTKESFEHKRPHYPQLMESLSAYHLNEKYTEVEIGALKSQNEFWKAFEEIVKHKELQKGDIELYVDLTFGYRIQPILVFLAVYFLDQMTERINVQKMYYGMHETNPPNILDMTELLELLQWMKAAQIFTAGGSGRFLMEKLNYIAGDKFSGVAQSFRELTDAYAFNYVMDLPRKSSEFQKFYRNKEFKHEVRYKFPVFNLIDKYLLDFISLFDGDNLDVQLKSARQNFKDCAYSRSIIILRECYITVFAQVFDLLKKKDREIIERSLINRVYWYVTDEKDKPVLSDVEIELAKNTKLMLEKIFGEESIKLYYQYWGAIRKVRNFASHISPPEQIPGKKPRKRVDDGSSVFDYSNKFKYLKENVEMYLNESETLFKAMTSKYELAKQYHNEINTLLNGENDKKLFVIVNEGIHPILPNLKAQYGDRIKSIVLTRGNTNFDQEKTIAKQCHKIAVDYSEYTIYLVPSGFSYLAISAYNVLQQALARHPVWLQFDSEAGKYHEKLLDPRKILGE